MDKWNDTIRKRDVVYVMGDAAFTQEGLSSIGTLSGRKILIRGNHDMLPTEDYLSVFSEIYGAFMYKGLWLTHIPIHPQELFGRTNVHGHCHRGGPTGVHQCGSTIRGHAIGAFANTMKEKINEHIRKNK
jgi:calcineurin-like phosphoesterase family protein